MPAVVLRLAGRNSLEPNAQPHPPHRQRRQPAKACRREGRAVVRANGVGQPVFFEEAHEDGLRAFCLRRRQRSAAQNEATEAICGRQRVAPRMVDDEVALEVHRPAVVGSCRLLQTRRRRGGRPAPSSALLHQAFALEQLTHRWYRSSHL